MSEHLTRRDFAARPVDPESWVKAADVPVPSPAPSPIADEAFTARLTIDVTPALRGRIKIAAFGRGATVADMLRTLLAREFPATDGESS